MDPARPHLVGDGPAECSACTDVARPLIIDANGYYRALGVHVRANRAEIKRAYLARLGHLDERLTWIVKFLLNHDLRRMYDTIPLGCLYIDPFIARDMQRAVTCRDAGKRQVTEVARATNADQHDASPPSSEWPWAWYRWSTDAAPAHLSAWQESLLSHLGGTPALHFAVGVHGFEEPYRVQQVGYRLVAFLRAGEEPQQAVAGAAAQDLQHLHTAGDQQTWHSDQDSVRPKPHPRQTVARLHERRTSRWTTATASSAAS